MVVGIIDDDTLQESEIEDDLLEELIEEMREDGIGRMTSATDTLPEGQASADVYEYVPYDPKYYWVVVSELESEGFEVETDRKP